MLILCQLTEYCKAYRVKLLQLIITDTPGIKCTCIPSLPACRQKLWHRNIFATQEIQSAGKIQQLHDNKMKVHFAIVAFFLYLSGASCAEPAMSMTGDPEFSSVSAKKDQNMYARLANPEMQHRAKTGTDGNVRCENHGMPEIADKLKQTIKHGTESPRYFSKGHGFAESPGDPKPYAGWDGAWNPRAEARLQRRGLGESIEQAPGQSELFRGQNSEWS